MTVDFFGNNDKNGAKIPIETKAALLKYYYKEECSIQSLVKKKWYNKQILDENETNHGKVILKFGLFQSELGTEIGLSVWKKSWLIQMYDDQDIHEPDIIIDDYEIPTSSQSMTNELLCLDLNDSFPER